MLLSPLGLLIFAWTAEKEKNWIFPLIGTAVFSCGSQIAYVAVQLYIVDLFENYAASALAGVAVSRGAVGCVFTVIGFKLYVALGYGW